MVGKARRTRIEIQGAVQGVGFRPLVYRLTRDLSLVGWVVNDSQGVVIEVEGDPQAIDSLQERLYSSLPPAASIETLVSTSIPPEQATRFEIRPSPEGGPLTAQMLPDLATCDACVAELFDPEDRRYRYPFTNCTHCGPRLSIILALPYDRSRTTMAKFEMCPDCRSEYEDPENRRFHAQPNACPRCGPSLTLWDRSGATTAVADDALAAAVKAIRDGEIVAIQGLGGFQLVVDARNGSALARLRERKPRRDKPLALMVPDLDRARSLCILDEATEALLRSPEAPIVLLPSRSDASVAAAVDALVAPNSSTLGVMLPYTPLHHLLLRDLDFPIVATSGNLSDEPICIDGEESIERLGQVADRFLIHDRPIARQVDDGIARRFGKTTTILRRARGHAPRPIGVDSELPSVLAVGAQLKNAVAISVGRRVFVSQHVGDMETPRAQRAFERIVRDFLELYDLKPVAVAHDMHPDYATTRWALQQSDIPTMAVQHHHAHLASCLADNRHTSPALGVIWDGTGYGTDGTVWGGEFLDGDAADFRRQAYFRPFPLPGGEAAIREPRRSAAGLLWEMQGAAGLELDLKPLQEFPDPEKRILARMLERGVNAPRTSSVGRLFDALAALLGLQQRSTYEGQAATAVEQIADRSERGAYPFKLESDDHGATRVDWRPTFDEVLAEIGRGTDCGTISARFHNALVDVVVELSRRGERRAVALSGGCFQNAWLVHRVTEQLTQAGCQVLLHRQVPPNDGGIALGQLAVAAARIARGDPLGG